jgi:flavin-binding protein dodecin
MSKIYKMIDVVGTSPQSFAEAARSAIAEAGKTVKAMSWFEVDRLGGRIEGGKVAEFQAKLKIGFKVLNPEELKG